MKKLLLFVPLISSLSFASTGIVSGNYTANVQGSCGSFATSVTPPAMPLAVTVGNYIVVAIQSCNQFFCGGSGSIVFFDSITDTLGNTYNLVEFHFVDPSYTVNQALYVAKVTNGGSGDTLTATTYIGSDAWCPLMEVQEVTGISPSAIYNTAFVDQTSNTTVPTISTTSASCGSLSVGLMNISGYSPTSPSMTIPGSISFTSEVNPANGIVTMTGSSSNTTGQLSLVNLTGDGTGCPSATTNGIQLNAGGFVH